MGRFEVEIEDSKNMGGLRIMARYGIKNEKKLILLQKCPFKGWRGRGVEGLLFCWKRRKIGTALGTKSPGQELPISPVDLEWPLSP